MTRDVLVVIALLVATAIFGLVLIPIGISEGSGAAGPGLSARLMPQFAAGGIAVALIVGLGQYLTSTAEHVETPSPTEGRHPLRAIVAITICLVFAMFGFKLAGFYFGGIIMAAILTALLGERNLLKIIVIPILVLIVIYLVFELGFQIRLPKSGLFAGIAV